MAQTWGLPILSGASMTTAVQTDVAGALESLRTLHSGAAEPASMVAYMLWMNTSTGMLSQRNSANSAWIPLFAVTAGGIELNAADGYRQTVDGFFQDNVIASQAAVIISRLAAGAAFAWLWTAPRPGSVTGIQVKSTEARTAGTLTVEVYKNGAATGLTAVLDGTNTTFKVTTQAKDTDAFAAGDGLDVRITTDAGWLPITADIRVAIEVET